MAWLLADMQSFCSPFVVQLPTRDKKLGLVLHTVDVDTDMFWKVAKRVGRRGCEGCSAMDENLG